MLKDLTPGRQEAVLAKTFLTLGYLVHSVQDLTVPGHVRGNFQSHLADCLIDFMRALRRRQRRLAGRRSPRFPPVSTPPLII